MEISKMQSYRIRRLVPRNNMTKRRRESAAAIAVAMALAFILCMMFMGKVRSESVTSTCKGRRCGKNGPPSITWSWIKAKDNSNVNGAMIMNITREEWSYLSNEFLKCKVWQVEETMDRINCPYHYYCNSIYPGNYSIIADWFALFLTASSCLLLAVVVLWEWKGCLFGRGFSRRQARYWLPSGPLMFPLALLVLSKGERINSVFPLSYIAPAWLQLLHISALGTVGYEFYEVSRNVNAVVYEVSMVLGLLHASLYVDALIMPYYTGLQAFTSSSLSGVCRSCICRREVLVAGGTFSYRAWSYGTFAVVSAVLARLAFGLWWNHGTRANLMNAWRVLLECVAWCFTIAHFLQMMNNIPIAQQGLPYSYVVGPLALMLLLVFSQRLWNLYMALISHTKPQSNVIGHDHHDTGCVTLVDSLS